MSATGLDRKAARRAVIHDEMRASAMENMRLLGEMPKGSSGIEDVDFRDQIIYLLTRHHMSATGLDYKAARQAVARANPEQIAFREGLVRRHEMDNPSPGVWRLIDQKPIEVDGQLERLAGEVMEEHPEIGYRQALRAVALQHGYLFQMREYLYQVLTGA